MSNIHYGNTLHVLNMYGNPNVSYLDHNNPIVEGEEHYVVASQSLIRYDQSGIWKIESAASNQGPAVKVGDIVKLLNISSDRCYLCATSEQYGNTFYVRSANNRKDSDDSLQWEIYVPNGMKGDFLQETDVFHLKSCSSSAYLMIGWGAPSGTTGGIYGIYADPNQSYPGNESWRFTVVSSGQSNNNNNNNNNGGNQSNVGNGTFNLPQGAKFRVFALATSNVKQVEVYIDDEQKPAMTLPAGSAGQGHLIGSPTTYLSGAKVRIAVITAKGHQSKLISRQVDIDKKIYFGFVGAEDDTGNYNDSIVVMNWPA